MTAERRADLAFLVGLLGGIALFVASGALAVRDELLGTTDFSGIWSGARGLVLGHDPYDAATWPAFAATLGVQLPDSAVYGYPPWVAIALIPLALLPLPVAAWLWLGGSFALAAVATRALLRAALPGDAVVHGATAALLLVAQPGARSAVNGQWTFLLLAATVTCALLLDARPRRAAAAALAWLAKPQLFALVALGWSLGRPRFAAPAALAAAAIAAGAWVALPQWWPAWSSAVAPLRLAQPATVPALLADVAGPGGRITGYAAIVGLFVFVAVAFRGASAVALWPAASLAGAVYAWSYDQLLLVAPILLAARVVARRERRRARVVALAGAAVLAIATPLLYAVALARGRETLSVLVPVGVTLGLMVVLWPHRREA